MSIIGRRRTIALTSTLVTLLCVGLVMLGLIGSPEPASAQAHQSVLRLLSGAAEYQVPDSAEWQQAYDGLRLVEGSKIKTADGSHAILTFFDGSTLTLDPATEVEIELAQQSGDGDTGIVLKQLAGRTWSRVVKMGTPGSRYEIETPSGYALVRGTLFETIVDETGATTVRTTEGLVSVGTIDAEVDVAAGTETALQVGGLPSEPVVMALPQNQLSLMVGPGAIVSVCDPTGASTGQLPDGADYNQIIGSQLQTQADGGQTISIPNPSTGEYLIVLRAVQDGDVEIGLKGLCGGASVFDTTDSYAMEAGSEWLIRLALAVKDGNLYGASLGDIEPLGDQDPERIVTEGELDEFLSPLAQILDPDTDDFAFPGMTALAGDAEDLKTPDVPDHVDLPDQAGQKDKDGDEAEEGDDGAVEDLKTPDVPDHVDLPDQAGQKDKDDKDKDADEDGGDEAVEELKAPDVPDDVDLPDQAGQKDKDDKDKDKDADEAEEGDDEAVEDENSPNVPDQVDLPDQAGGTPAAPASGGAPATPAAPTAPDHPHGGPPGKNK